MIYLKKLTLFNIRNHTHENFDFVENKVVFWGDNGQGKTNILEAISLLGLGKSWRETSGQDLIEIHQDSGKIQALFGRDQYDILIEPKRRQFFKNEKKISLTSHLGKIPTLLFCPEYLGLFTGGKTERLKFFDRFMVQIDDSYKTHLLMANRAHKQKITCLRQFQDSPGLTEMLQPWNNILAETMPIIIKARQKVLLELTVLLQRELDLISGNNEPVSIKFECSENFEVSKDGIQAFFKQVTSREIAARKNLIAPHSGNFQFYLRNKKLTQTASRGETRSVLLALIAAQKAYYQSIGKPTPILLLDDVFSELDDNRQKHLEHLCEGAQTFFTTTHKEHFQNFSGKIQSIAI